MADEILKPEAVAKPRFLEIVIPDTIVNTGRGRVIANRLFIFTGTAVRGGVQIDDNLDRWTASLDISRLPGHPVFNGSPFSFIIVPDPAHPGTLILKAATVASLAVAGWDDNADHAIWAVDAAEAIDINDHLVLLLNLAAQGEGCGVGRISYQINLLAHAQSG